MKTGSSVVLLILVLAGFCQAQIDTRISPVPPQPSDAPSQPAAKWRGVPLTGFLDTVGSALKEGLETTLSVSESVTNQYTNASLTNYGYDELSRVTGTMSFRQASARSSFLVQYAGGTDVYAKNSIYDDQFHQLGASEALKLSRWNLSLDQGLSYLPQSSFGFNPSHAIGDGLLTANSSNGPGVDSFLPPTVTQRGISTDATAEYTLGRRSGVSFTGGFNDYRFDGVDPGTTLFDSQFFTAGTHYRYTLSRQNELGAEYTFTQSRFIGFGTLMQVHSALATLKVGVGRRLTFQMAAGPQSTTFNQNGIETTLGISAKVTATAKYQFGRTSIGITYFRGVNPGSGTFAGSQADDIRASAERRVQRNLKISAAAGYSRNDNLGVITLNTGQQIRSTYVTGQIDRDFGRMLSAFVSYSFQNQDNGVCSAGICTLLPQNHLGMVGIRFHLHPLTLRP